MIAVLSPPDAMLLAALVAAAGAYVHDRRTMVKNATKVAEVAREFTNNGGATARDSLDRIEETQAAILAKIDLELVPRLDRGAAIIAEHADRLATLEVRQATARTRKTDKERTA